MENLFNQKDYEAILLRFSSITTQSERLWGKMEVNQMVVHVKDQLDIALGNKPAKPQGLVILRTIIGRWLALYIIPWRKGKEATPMEMDTLKNSIIFTDFENDKNLLILRIKEFIAAPGFAPHPFFGKISNKDWGRLAWKHINHHLWQFGA
ncbi:MAG: DUF1569 domain-containing protein [Ferruginibacter sp.]